MHPCPGNWWRSGVRSCIVPGLPTHLVQELNVGTVCMYKCTIMYHPIPVRNKQNVYKIFLKALNLFPGPPYSMLK